jgi:hypothetical protein
VYGLAWPDEPHTYCTYCAVRCRLCDPRGVAWREEGPHHVELLVADTEAHTLYRLQLRPPQSVRLLHALQRLALATSLGLSWPTLGPLGCLPRNAEGGGDLHSLVLYYMGRLPGHHHHVPYVAAGEERQLWHPAGQGQEEQLHTNAESTDAGVASASAEAGALFALHQLRISRLTAAAHCSFLRQRWLAAGASEAAASRAPAQ